MMAWSQIIGWSAALTLFLGCSAAISGNEVAGAGHAKAQITVLYDAFGKDPAMQKDWGYSALVECGGKRILFDTGNNPDVLEQNAKAKHIDLSKLDFVVMSHRHGDHMGGLSYLLRVNPKVKIYAPKEGFGVYGADLPSTFYRKDASLPAEQRYFNGTPPEVLRFGSAMLFKSSETLSSCWARSRASERIWRISSANSAEFFFRMSSRKSWSCR